ncbi:MULTISPECIES: GtrA family protein [Giesbergeria]|uniref:GtrA family protein n=1 Tax=Giesbergeria sinuosa TaxID=80883 RepID=A0ABV9QI94_9BURK
MKALLMWLRSWPQPLRFVLVGGAAASTHLLVVALLVQGLQWLPLTANVLAFLLAFWVSYGGHALLTFVQAGVAHRQALPRFFVVACAAFVVNEVLYFAALRWLPWHYLISLFLVLLAVAVGTFVSSKLWAFAQPPP